MADVAMVAADMQRVYTTLQAKQLPHPLNDNFM